MTRQDIRVALIVLAVVVTGGWLIGYAIGTWTQPDRTVPVLAQRDTGGGDAGPAAAARPADTFPNPDGGVFPGYENVYVNDYADLLDSMAEARIRERLDRLYLSTGIEMTVLTLESMWSYGHDGPIEPFATGLFNSWGIGDATRNDGVLVLVAAYERSMRIELGSGYDRSWDARMQRVIDTAFLPRFRRDAYQEGISAGVDEILHQLTGTYPGEEQLGVAQRGWRWLWRWVRSVGLAILLVLVVPLGGAALWVRRYLRNRDRICSQCRATMQRAGEQADDEHLDGGQRLEEYLGSVDYDVWHCRDCGHMLINRYGSWFAGHGACPQCGYRTLSTTSKVLFAATTKTAGSKRVDYDCQHCAYHDSEVRTIPKRSSSSGSGGSGRSSFGGGSSSGGGASGSW